MGIHDKFLGKLKESSDIAQNFYLEIIQNQIKNIELCSYNCDILKDYIKKMEKLLDKENFPLNGEFTNEFIQCFGEADFVLHCYEANVEVEKVPESTIKTPDFKSGNKYSNIFFEIKTLSISNGRIGINKNNEASLDQKIYIEDQTKLGTRLIVSEREIISFGCIENGRILPVIEFLMKKCENNFKQGQFEKGNTFLVLNLCMLSSIGTETELLRPVYFQEGHIQNPITGILWMLAFGKPGTLIHRSPDFEGSNRIDGHFEKYGLLMDSGMDKIAGLFIILYPLGKKSLTYGLFRNKDYSKWEDDDEYVISIIKNLVGENWNDEQDSNGYKL